MIYEVKFSFDEAVVNDSLSSRVAENTAEQNEKAKEKGAKTAEQLITEKNTKIAGAVTTGLAVAAKGYEIFLQVRNHINANRIVDLSIGGDLVSAQNLQTQTGRDDTVAGYIQSVLNPVLTMGVAGFASGGLHGALIGAGAGLIMGSFGLVKDLVSQNLTLTAQQSAFAANVQLGSYLKNLEKDRLVKNAGYYRE